MRSHEERVAETKRRITKIEREKRLRRNTVTMASAAAVFPAQFGRCAASSPRRAPHDSAFVIPSRSSSLRRLSFPRYTMLVICFTVFPVTSAACA